MTKNDQVKIHKVFTKSQWLEFNNTGSFSGSPIDLKDGFIHLSGQEQVQGVLERHFKGIRPLFVAEFASVDFGDSLVWEISNSGGTYPHLYGVALWLDEVVSWYMIE